MITQVLDESDNQQKINDAVDYSNHGYIEVYEMDTHNNAQKANNKLEDEAGDTLEQQSIDAEQKDDGKIYNTIEEVELDDSDYHQQNNDQDKQEVSQMRMSSQNVFYDEHDEQQLAIDHNQRRKESE